MTDLTDCLQLRNFRLIQATDEMGQSALAAECLAPPAANADIHVCGAPSGALISGLVRGDAYEAGRNTGS